jgi:hypothetical protein
MTYQKALIRVTKPPTLLQRALVHAALLPTWQTAAAIAQHGGVPARTAFTVLQRHANEWHLEMRRVRIDGHNEISVWRQRRMQVVMGVSVPVEEEIEAEA